MSNTGRLPTSSESQTIGERAGKCFNSNCPESWRIKSLDGTDDFGLDYQVQRLERDQVADIFRVQLKGTTVPALNAEGTHFSIQLKASTIRYYARITEPILLVLCDLSSNTRAILCPLYYVWIPDELRRIDVQDMPDEQVSVSLRVPKANLLDHDTDLSGSLSQFRALANVGLFLDMTLERNAPSLDSEARAILIEKLPIGFSTRGAALMESLAENPITVWPNRPFGSMAWLLHEAEGYLNNGNVDRASEMLASATETLRQAVSLEIAEYWYLKGRLHLLNDSHEDACAAFENAIAAEPSHSKYVAAWAEVKLVHIYSIDSANDFSSIYSKLTSSDPAVLAIKARALAAEQRYDEAFEILGTFSGVEELLASAIIHTTRSAHCDALKVCGDGLALPEVKEANRLLFVILKARAQFHLAIGIPTNPSNDEIRIPLAGTPGMNLELLAEAWQGCAAAVEGLRTAGWPANTDFVVDILCAMASIFEKKDETLAILSDAASKRPNLPTLQNALESLAMQTGDFLLAMQANARLPQTTATKLRRVVMLHMAKKDAECVSFFESNLPDFDQGTPMFGDALACAISSADRLIKIDLVNTWLTILRNRPEHAPRSAVLDYWLVVSKNKAKRQQALDALLGRFEEYSRPFSIAVQLIDILNPSATVEAEQLIVAAEVVTRDRLLSVNDTLQLAQALTTMERWSELLSLTEEALSRFSDDKMLVAVKSLALDRLGRTAEAKALLAPAIAQGIAEGFILNTYINIATRCGFIEEAIQAMEALVPLAKNPEEKIQHLRALYSLIRTKDPLDSRAYDIAWRIGELVDPNNEMDEGAFLMMFMISPEKGGYDGSRVAEFQQRLAAFQSNFPQSSILRGGSVSENASPEELLAAIMKLVGDTPEKIQARQKRENLLQEEKHPIPFAWRPNVFISNVHDVLELWEMSKQAQGRDQKLLLNMAASDWQALSWNDMRNRTPLLDIVALLVAQDLGILDLLFKLFPKIAVSQDSLRDLMKMINPLKNSVIYEKCYSIQSTLQANFEQVLQPRASNAEVDDEINLPTSLQEVKALSRQPPYLLYSDDLFFRIFCREYDENFRSICTLDILLALESEGLLTTAEVAEKFGQLCSWGVGLVIEQRLQLASLPVGLNDVTNVAAGVEMLQATPFCISIFNGIWSRPQISYRELQAHAGNLFAIMLCDSSHSAVAIASLMAIWHNNARHLPDAYQEGLSCLSSVSIPRQSRGL